MASSPSVVITGDFNAKNSDWLSTDETDVAGETLQDVFLRFNMYECVGSPTRYWKDSGDDLRGALLDLVVTTVPANITNVLINSLIATFDHAVCRWTLNMRPKIINPLKRLWCTRNVNAENYIKALHQAPWDDVFQDEDTADINILWDRWAKLFIDISTKFIPSKCVKKPKHKPGWLSGEVDRAIQLKKRLFTEFKSSRSDSK